MPFRKNVFILGAGFSAEAGAPVMRDFFTRAMNLWKDPNSSLEPDERERFEQVYVYRRALDVAESRVHVDLDNIEDLFGIVEMEAQVGGENTQTIRENLAYVILRTIEIETTNIQKDSIPFLYKHQNEVRGDSPQTSLFSFFVNVVTRRWNPLAKMQKVAQDSVISLNYDLLLERAMEDLPLAPSYDLPADKVKESAPEIPATCKLRVLKLHGSANWATCPACQDKIYVLQYKESPVTRALNSPHCETCGGIASRRLIAPPTWNKIEYLPFLSSVWKSAVRELEQAQRIFIIGYSMPDTDKFFQYLLALSMSKNQLLDEVIVVNNNREDREKIAKLFRRLHERGKTFRPNEGFRAWVMQRSLQEHLQQVFPSNIMAW